MADATKIGVADATKMGVANARVAYLLPPGGVSFLALLGKKFPEKLSGLSVKRGGGPPLSAKEKNLLFSD